jgi:hypothetical protein
MMGATAGAASTFAGRETSEARPKWAAMSGAVANVAAVVIAVASASPTGSPRAARCWRSGVARTRRATTAAKLSCHPGSSTARGFSVSVQAAASSSAYHREDTRPASAATVPAPPMTPARMIDGPPPARGT